MNKAPQPPRLFLRFFRWFCNPDYREDIVGDLLGRFEKLAAEKGVSTAKRFFIKEVSLLFRLSILKDVLLIKVTGLGMTRNYFLTTLRSAQKEKGLFFLPKFLATPLYLIFISSIGQAQNVFTVPDVLNYLVEIEPNIQERSLVGRETIRFITEANSQRVVLDCGYLTIDSLSGDHVKSFYQRGQKLFITLISNTQAYSEIHINYHAKPIMGVAFSPETSQVYTVFHTSQWMVCNDDPSDKASIQTVLITADTLTGIANGSHVEKSEIENRKVRNSWKQSSSTSTYTYGFAIGSFNNFTDERNGIELNYFSNDHSPEELEAIFRETANMMHFFEEKSGIQYYENSYSQVIGQGRSSQEMGGFTVMRESYGDQVLNDTTQIHLAAHELAHQWWGNQVTCRDWNHFWLNEGLAVYMSSAFREYRFGKEAYLADIKVYYDAYIKVEDLDKPLVFESWDNPTSDDRTIVYYKGAYFIHLLRKELRDNIFWEGIRDYTKFYFGKSVVSEDFQNTMEKVANRDLDDFFKKWVYQTSKN